MIGGAIKAGADFEVIGRRIFRANNPTEEAMKFANILQEIVSKQILVEA